MILPGKSEFAQLGQKIQVRRFLREVGRVKHLKPVDTECGRKDVAIGFLTSSLHLPLMLLAAKSFYYFSGIVCPLYVWDDGSLTSRNRDEVHKLFPAARLLRRSDYDLGPLARYPLISAFAQRRLEKYEKLCTGAEIDRPARSPALRTALSLAIPTVLFRLAPDDRRLAGLGRKNQSLHRSMVGTRQCRGGGSPRPVRKDQRLVLSADQQRLAVVTPFDFQPGHPGEYSKILPRPSLCLGHRANDLPHLR